MQEEYFDIVDENNVNTGERKPRSEVHATGFWHRTAHIYYFRNENDTYYFLVHLRAETKDLQPNRWDTRFGGHVKAGDTIEKTAVDEMKEEIGLAVSFSDLLEGPVRKMDNFPNREFTHVFYYKGEKDISNLNFEDDEVQEVRWMSEDEMIDSMEKNPDLWSGSPEGFEFILKALKDLG